MTKASKAEKTAASLTLAKRQKQLKVALKNQINAKKAVKTAAHAVQLRKTDVKLRMEQLQAKRVVAKVASDALVSAKAGIIASTKEAAIKKDRLKSWMKKETQKAVHKQMSVGKTADSKTAQELKTKFGQKMLAIQTTKAANLKA